MKPRPPRYIRSTINFSSCRHFEVGNLRLIARLDQRLEARRHQRADAAAQHGLLAEQVRFGFSENVVSITPARVQPMPLA
jgi:hypothetical protein